jgi:hypothetical protein
MTRLVLTFEAPGTFREAMAAMGPDLSAISDPVEPDPEASGMGAGRGRFAFVSGPNEPGCPQTSGRRVGPSATAAEEGSLPSNQCLLAAGVLSGLILAISAGALDSLAWHAGLF